MRRTIVLTCVMAAMCMGTAAFAIEGGALYVDTLAVEATSFNQVGSGAVTLDGEVAVGIPTEDWSILAGLSWRNTNPNWSETDLDGAGGKLGIKYYFTRMTSLALYGSLEEYDAVASKDVVSACMAFEQRFTPARSGVSPFVNAGLALRFPNYELADPVEDRDRDYLVKLGLGCDFMITPTLALAFGANYTSILGTLSDIKDLTDNDGWTGSVAFVGYWD